MGKRSKRIPQRRRPLSFLKLLMQREPRNRRRPVDVGEMQKKLRRWATEEPTQRFVALYSLLCNPLWLRVAHHKVNANQGRETAGIDGQSMRDFNADLEGNLERLRQLLIAKTFEPIPVRRVYTPARWR
jgi:retron-type reverse transcriptase